MAVIYCVVDWLDTVDDDDEDKTDVDDDDDDDRCGTIDGGCVDGNGDSYRHVATTNCLILSPVIIVINSVLNVC